MLKFNAQVKVGVGTEVNYNIAKTGTNPYS